jgi:transposase
MAASMPPEMIEQCKALWENHISNAEIERRTGVTRGTIIRWVRELGWERSPDSE